MTSTLAPHPTPVLGAEVTVGPPVRRLGQTVHVVRDVRSDGYFQVSPREAFVLTRLDGTRTFGDVERDYRGAFGKDLGDASWQQLMGLLYARRLLVPPGEDAEAGRTAYEQLRQQNQAGRVTPPRVTRVRVPLIDPGPVIGWLQGRAAWLLHPVTAAVATALVLLMLLTVGLRLPLLWEGYVASWASAPVTVAVGVVVVLLSLLVHEFTHALTCVRYGGRCREMGISWRFPLITIYTKVEDIYLVPHRWQRVVVSLSGVLGGLVVLLPVFVTWLLVPAGHPVAETCVVVLVLGGMAQLVNLAPVLGLDGQKALSHALGVWDVADESRAYWTAVLRRRPAPVADGAARWVVPVYGVVVVLLLSVVTLWTVWVGVTLLVTGEVPW
ncbi:hypothetical protein MWU75_07940 [Ornithinimicrobium sp. F0845]|uniref:hypothetical protein n=1 Tax=Ornithinimicrobium sp. F0845 TaxID=2926412 RepID=UPI001FF6C3D1|nr:hypothetical protein [Ornithinimicrobium sp. F0845]MCK0112063.1 hypothetical protein [Ornithinimicrobium sp. F0845]